uniref:Tripartite motif-containing protein 16-like n=1 Tax=Sander lucioperca TaxID=283035 RepID=A0A8D0A8X5_SANLU
MAAVQLDRDAFSCSICLDLLKDPVTIPCGHSYCMDCIKEFWDEKKIYSCPQCRENFTPRPVVVKSTMLSDLVEQLKKTGLQAAPADHCYAGPDMWPHSNPVLYMFCRTDQQLICYLCPVDEHKGHDTVSAAAERTERQKELEVSQQNIQQRIQDREKDVKLLQQEVEAINCSADKKRSSDVEQQVRSQQKTEVSRVKELQEKLEQEITELKRKDAELKKISDTEDHNQFLKNYPSLSPLSESTDSSSIDIRPLNYFEDVTAAVSDARDKLQDVLRDTWTNISLAVTEVDVLLSQPEPKTRADFLKYSREITLDPNTAHTQLLLSEGERKATLTYNNQDYSSHPDRFSVNYQVLSRESLTGRCYWEVEWTGGGVHVAVTYKNISRVGDLGKFGKNEKSWVLRCVNNSYQIQHNKVKTPVSGPVSSRVGVYLDHRAGTLSFYSVSDTMTLLHRVQTTFTQPLYAGLLLYYRYGDTAEFCKLEV